MKKFINLGAPKWVLFIYPVTSNPYFLSIILLSLSSFINDTAISKSPLEPRRFKKYTIPPNHSGRSKDKSEIVTTGSSNTIKNFTLCIGFSDTSTVYS